MDHATFSLKMLTSTGSWVRFREARALAAMAPAVLFFASTDCLAGCSGWDCINPVKVIQNAVGTAGDIIKVVTTAAGDVITTTQKAGGDVVTVVKKAGGDVETTVVKAGGDTKKTLAKAGGDTVTTITKAGSDTVTTIEKSAGDLTTTVAKAGGDTTRTVVKAGGDTITTLTTAGGDVSTTVHKSFGDVYLTVQKAGADTLVTIQKAGDDTVTTVDKGWKDSSAETQRAFKNIVEVKTALVRYTESEYKGSLRTLSNAERRIREGKAIDALWGLGTEPLKTTNDSAAAAAQESIILNTVGQVAASAYGGPAGAAAYAAWYTYNLTGDASLALRVGMITGATSAAFGAVGKMPNGTAGAIMKKTIVGGAIGGLSVAAAGGDRDAIKNGFLMSGGVILIQSAYQDYTHHPLDDKAYKASAHEGYCMATVGADCSPPSEAYARDAKGNILDENNQPLDKFGNKIDAAGKIQTAADGTPLKGVPQVDVTKTDPTYNHVGKWSTATDHSVAGERGAFMNGVSKVPGMNAMALFHDKWCVDTNMGQVGTVSSIIPATVITYIGSGAPVYTKIQTTFVDKQRQSSTNRGPGSVSHPASGVQSRSTQALPSAAVNVTQVHPTTVAQGAAKHDETITCVAGDRTRTIAVATQDGKGCRVFYSSESGLTTPWRTKTDQAYCAPKANDLASQLRSNGWLCHAT